MTLDQFYATIEEATGRTVEEIGQAPLQIPELTPESQLLTGYHLPDGTISTRLGDFFTCRSELDADLDKALRKSFFSRIFSYLN